MAYSCEMYELVMPLRGKGSSWAPYVGLREQQSLADVCEAMVKDVPEVPISPC